MSRQDIIRNMRINPAKLTEWKNLATDGLYPLELDTEEDHYLTDEVIDFAARRPRRKPVTAAPVSTRKRKNA